MSDRQRKVFMPEKESFWQKFVFNFIYVLSILGVIIIAGLIVWGLISLGHVLDGIAKSVELYTLVSDFLNTLPEWVSGVLFIFLAIVSIALLITIVQDS